MASNLRVDSIVPATGGSVSIGTATGGVTIPGDLGIAGVLSYEDVTNVDSVGVITARGGIRIGATGANSLITGNADGIGIKTAAPSNLALEIASPFNDIARMTGPNSGNITFRNATANEVILHTGNSDALIFGTNGNNERIRIGTSGQIGIGGANYGTSGQVLTSQGSGSAVQWASPVIYTEYSSQTLSGANSYATTITGNPKIFEVSLYKLRTVASQNTMYRLSTSAGEITSGYHDISYAVRAGNSAISNAVRGSGQGQGCLTNYDFTNPDNLISGEAKFTRVAAGLYTWQAMYDHRFDPSRSGGDANDQYLLNSKGHIADFSSSGSGIVTQFRIFTSGGGNFTSGKVTVRGIA